MQCGVLQDFRNPLPWRWRKLERFQQERHCTHFIMATQLPGLDPHKGTRSLELFAREIMPHFRRA